MIRDQGKRTRRRSLMWGLDSDLFFGTIVNRLRIERWFVFPLPEGIPPRSPWKAAMLSLIPGLGQIYNYQPKKALYFFVAWVAVLVAVVVTFYQPYNHYILGAAVLWMAYAFHDGLKTSIQINRQYWDIIRSLSTYLAFIFEIGLFFILAQFVSSMLFVKYRYMSESAMTPVIERGDRIAIDILSYRLRKPRIGEIVYYNPKQIKIESGVDAYVIDEFNSFERILAGPGQTLEKRQGHYYRDGIEIPEDQGPVVKGPIYWDFKLTASEGNYIVLFTYTGSEWMPVIGSNGAPGLGHPIGWEDACIVPKQDIIGRAWFIYHPPPRRRFLRRPDSLLHVKEPAN